MTIHEAKTYIKSHLPVTEILAQLAEECSELAQAAHKLRRAIDGANPTPVTVEEAREDLLEECGDIDNCLELLLTAREHELIAGARPNKFPRWAKRLREKGGRQ